MVDFVFGVRPYTPSAALNTAAAPSDRPANRGGIVSDVLGKGSSMADQVGALTTAAERLDRSVPAADEVGNAVLIDDRRIMRLAGPLFVLFSILLVPWTVFIALVLPSRQLSPNYDVAWAGFDVFLCVGLGATGYFALRRSRWLPLAAAATATHAGDRCLVRCHDVAVRPRPRRGDSACSACRDPVVGSLHLSCPPRSARQRQAARNGVAQPSGPFCPLDVIVGDTVTTTSSSKSARADPWLGGDA